ncbi:hypothetical protein ASPFODRAFT_301666 [Aspergillus luchuensis CBS 106.47]|uniref:Uncharacterized protein n=1 Tax=Aspergillus luchuensis (strain CBS 106.47) TaxID=1137211 RepID=A0A1M3TBD9_ASPLC|nr:hypothetical protein ASPFODRAFT_301666 [Aspergillus luchuensis CBS 106.47]
MVLGHYGKKGARLPSKQTSSLPPSTADRELSNWGMCSSHVSPISQVSRMYPVQGKKKKSRIGIPILTLYGFPSAQSYPPFLLFFSPVSVKENAWNLSLAWFSPTCPAAYPVEPALHHVLPSWSPSRHEEYLARLLSYYLLIHHFLPLFSRTVMILLRMHCVFS